MPGSNQRWCSDKMTIVCWNGEVVELVFAVDCHDREVIAVVAEACAVTGAEVRRLMRKAVFARYANERPAEPIQWLLDNEGIYTALETVIAAERLGLTPITTPVASPESNGMAEAFVHTLRRDYLDDADRSSAARILEQVPGWIADYNHNAPHSSLGMKSPVEYRRLVHSRGRDLSHEIGVRTRGCRTAPTPRASSRGRRRPCTQAPGRTRLRPSSESARLCR